MTVRIKDIAAKAGVSTGTVDRVIHKRGNVKPDVQARVEQVMSELGYQRNFIASTLAYNRTLHIATLIFNGKDSYWRQIKAGIDRAQEASSHYGVRITHYFGDQNDPQEFAKQANKILEARPDAVLFAPLFLQEGLNFLDACHTRNIPVVLINTELQAPGALCYIGQDSYQSGHLAARLLHFGIKNEATALLLNLDADSQNAQHLKDKERGFREYFAENHEQDIKIISRNFSKYDQDDSLLAFLSTLLQSNPNLAGIFITNSRAYRIVECLEKLKRSDLVIVGFDLIPENVAHLRNNKIDFLINQNPLLQGYLGIMNIVNYVLLKKEITQLQYLPLDVVVTENCAYYEQSNYALPLVI